MQFATDLPRFTKTAKLQGQDFSRRVAYYDTHFRNFDNFHIVAKNRQKSWRDRLIKRMHFLSNAIKLQSLVASQLYCILKCVFFIFRKTSSTLWRHSRDVIKVSVGLLQVIFESFIIWIYYLFLKTMIFLQFISLLLE